MLDIDEITIDYIQKRAINKLSIQLQPGSITALMGSNGSGKTTLIRSIAGLEAPFTGRVILNGVDIYQQNKRSPKDIGYLADEFGLYCDLTVRASLKFHCDSYKIPKWADDSFQAQLLAKFKLNCLLEKKISEITRGQRQLLGICLAILIKPKLVLLDEPTAGLDTNGRQALSEVLKQLKEEQTIVVLSSHNLAELEECCDNIMLLKEGNIIKFAPLSVQQKRIELKLSHSEIRLVEHLAEQEKVANIQAIAANKIHFDFLGDKRSQQLLLTEMLQLSFPIDSFQQIKCDFVEDSNVASEVEEEAYES